MNFTTLILSVISFVVYFCFVSLLVYRPSTTKIEKVIPQPTFSYKDAFSSEYDPEPEVTVDQPSPSYQLCLPAKRVRRHNEVKALVNDVIIPAAPQQLYLSAVRVRRHNQVKAIANDVIIPAVRQELYLPASRQRRHNQVEAIANAIIIPVPTQPEIPAQPNIPPLPQKRTVTQLRKFIKDHNLQAVVREKAGKTYSKCNQQELLRVLEG